MDDTEVLRSRARQVSPSPEGGQDRRGRAGVPEGSLVPRGHTPVGMDRRLPGARAFPPDSAQSRE